MNISECMPQFISAHTKIWDVTAAALAEQTAPHSTIKLWIVHAPWMHLAWPYHYCGLIHLRDVPGINPCVKKFPEATHEFMVYAVHPDFIPQVQPFSNPALLRPVSIVQQFTAESDEAAHDKVEHLMNHVVEGKLSVDSDFRPVWRLLLAGFECPE